ncbi:MAG: tyrosine-type recombinase/integrase [Planctomycetes bacterium]|nr:tyrosine-type recombinase/integrase [Planctomycetota bacterium]
MAKRQRGKGASIARGGNKETGTFVITFRDPRRRQDPSDPTKGKKPRRNSLGTKDRQYAEQLRDHLNRIIFDRGLWRTPHADCPAIIRKIWLGLEDVAVETEEGSVAVVPADGISGDELELDLKAIDPNSDGLVFDADKIDPNAEPPFVVRRVGYTVEETAKSFAAAYRRVNDELQQLRAEHQSLTRQYKELEIQNKSIRHRLNQYDKRAARRGKVGTLAEELTTYLVNDSARKITPKRMGIRKSTLTSFVEKMGPNRRADDVTESEVAKYVEVYRAKDGNPIGEERRKEIRAQVCTFLEQVTHGSFSRTAVQRIAGHKVSREQKKIVWLEPQEVSALLEKMYEKSGNYWGDAATIQAFMGWRPSELILLKKANVAGNYIELDPITDAKSGLTRAKTGGRAVPIPDAAMEVVRRRTSRTKSIFLIPPLRKKRVAGVSRKTAAGIPWTEDYFLKKYVKRLRQAARAAEIKKPIDSRTLRRTFASISIRRGVSFEKVARLLGNRVTTVRRHYARLEAKEIDNSGFSLNPIPAQQASKPATPSSKSIES